MAHVSKLIVIRSACENGFYFTFKMCGRYTFVSRFFDSAEKTYEEIERMRDGLTSDGSIRKRIAQTGDVYFVYLHRNGVPVGESMPFSSVTKMELAIDYLRKNFPESISYIDGETAI